MLFIKAILIKYIFNYIFHLTSVCVCVCALSYISRLAIDIHLIYCVEDKNFISNVSYHGNYDESFPPSAWEN